MEKNDGFPEEWDLLPGAFTAKAIFRGIQRALECGQLGTQVEAESGAESMLERLQDEDDIHLFRDGTEL